MSALLIMVFIACVVLAWWGRMTVYCAFSQREEGNGWFMLGLGLIGCVCTLAAGGAFR